MNATVNRIRPDDSMVVKVNASFEVVLPRPAGLDVRPGSQVELEVGALTAALEAELAELCDAVDLPEHQPSKRALEHAVVVARQVVQESQAQGGSIRISMLMAFVAEQVQAALDREADAF